MVTVYAAVKGNRIRKYDIFVSFRCIEIDVIGKRFSVGHDA